VPHLTIPFSGHGPLIDLLVGVSAQRRRALKKVGQPIPEFQKTRALIDTGASSTCIDSAVLKPLELTATGAILIHTPSTSGKPHFCEQFDVGLGIDHPSKDPMMLHTIPVISTELAAQGIGALIGRDVLSSCLLIYDGSAASFTLGF
jgi:aspartyl protease